VEASEQTYALIETVEAEHPARLRRTAPTPIKNRAVKIANATTDDDALHLFHTDRIVSSDGFMASVARKRTGQQNR